MRLCALASAIVNRSKWFIRTYCAFSMSDLTFSLLLNFGVRIYSYNTKLHAKNTLQFLSCPYVRTWTRMSLCSFESIALLIRQYDVFVHRFSHHFDHHPFWLKLNNSYFPADRFMCPSCSSLNYEMNMLMESNHYIVCACVSLDNSSFWLCNTCMSMWIWWSNFSVTFASPIKAGKQKSVLNLVE